jgi:hypothetical protein
MRSAVLPVSLCLFLPRVLAAGGIQADGVDCTLAEAIVAANTDTDAAGCLGTSGAGHADTIHLGYNVSITAAEALASGSTLMSGTRAGLPDIESVITIAATADGDLIERAPQGCVSGQAEPSGSSRLRPGG